jgi:peptidoglycan/xylan/chitin deacetylase (PgdA/CDA1 family)
VTVLKKVKIALLSIARRAGVVQLCLNSRWRQQKLLILCYHGTSLADEHLWDPSLYVDRSFLTKRLAYLRQKRCSVLPLTEALERLFNDDLPPRSVCLTYDDGTYDFYSVALPILAEFDYPVTLYLTTYYCYYNKPVFDPMCSYLLWKGRGQTLRLPEVFSREISLSENMVTETARGIKDFAIGNGLSGSDKNLLLAKLAMALGINYESICSSRLLHLMTPEEAATAARRGVDVQLHTHRHRVYDSRSRFEQEIEDNRRHIERIATNPVKHFCYPGGFYLPVFPQWLREAGVVSATTCEQGLATRQSDPLLLPRLIDTSSLSVEEFSGWISGLASLLPKRPYEMNEDKLVRGETPI